VGLQAVPIWYHGGSQGYFKLVQRIYVL